MKRAASLGAFAVVFASSTVARAQISINQLLGRNPDDSVHVDAYVGVDYTSLSRQNEDFSVRGLSREPYVLKTASFEVTNLSRFDFALNAAATSLLAVGGFSKPADQTQNPDSLQAERYAALLRYALSKKYKVRTEGQFARMATYVVPNATYYSAYPVTTYYAPASGGLTRLHPGDGEGGNTNWYQAAVLVESTDRILGFEGALGFRILELDTLSAYGARTSGSIPVFQGLVEDKFLCQAVAQDSTRRTYLFPNVYSDIAVHLNAGYASVSSAFVNTAGGVCIDIGAVGSLVYEVPHFRLDVGLVLDELAAVTFVGGNTLSQALAYNNPANDRVAFAAAGSKWSVGGPAESIYAIGLFTHLTAHF